jgi:hypothetical protein
MDGFTYNGTLYLALMQMHATGSGGAFGFSYSGSQLVSINNYTASPSQWSMQYQQLNTGGSAVPGISIVANQGPSRNPNPVDPQGATYAYFFTGVGSPPYLALLRIPLTQLSSLARPGNTSLAIFEYKRRLGGVARHGHDAAERQCGSDQPWGDGDDGALSRIDKSMDRSVPSGPRQPGIL